MDFFGAMTFEDLLHSLEGMCEKIVTDYQLPPRSVVVLTRIGTGKTTKGKVTSYALCISEPTWPTTERELLDENRTQSPVVSLKAPTTQKWSGFVEFGVSQEKQEFFSGFTGAEFLPQNKQDIEFEKQRIRVPIGEELLEMFDKFVRLAVENYVSTSEPFGCCDLYEKCSDAKRCLHPSFFRRTVCAYKKNLEAGRVFYGKNANA